MLARLPARWRESRAGAVDFAPVRISRQRDPSSRWRDFRASVRQSALLYMHASAPDFAPARCSRRRARKPRWRTDPQLLCFLSKYGEDGLASILTTLRSNGD